MWVWQVLLAFIAYHWSIICRKLPTFEELFQKFSTEALTKDPIWRFLSPGSVKNPIPNPVSNPEHYYHSLDLEMNQIANSNWSTQIFGWWSNWLTYSTLACDQKQQSTWPPTQLLLYFQQANLWISPSNTHHSIAGNPFDLQQCYLHERFCVDLIMVNIICIYTVVHKKTCHFYFSDNSGKYWRIFVIFSLLYSARNCRIRTC